MKTRAFLVVLGLSLCLAGSVHASDGDAGAPDTGWFWGAFGAAYGIEDSNPNNINESQTHDVSVIAGRFGGSGLRRWTRGDGWVWWKYADVGIALDHDVAEPGSQAELAFRSTALRAWVDFDLLADSSAALKRVTVAARGTGYINDFGHDQFNKGWTGEGGIRLSLRGTKSCDLDHVFVYWGHEEVEDQRTERTQFDRTGDREEVGLEYTVTLSSRDASSNYCYRTGPFQRFSSRWLTTLTLGYRAGKYETDGDEFDSDYGSAFLRGTIMLPTNHDTWSVDYRVAAVRTRYDNPSFFDTATSTRARRDSGLDWEIGVRRHIVGPWKGRKAGKALQEVHVVVATGSEQQRSNVEFFDFRRDYVRVGLEFQFGPSAGEIIGDPTGGSGGTSKSGGDSGTSKPVVLPGIG